MDAELHRRCANTIKGLAMDAVQAANSGHPGMPMGMADAAIVLWTRFLRFDPQDPGWPDRDRFVLSAGHGSMLLYALLHLAGYDVSIEDLRSFRQWGSNTPGHPEVGETPGVETTTGPLGQGFANAVGMAIAERTLRETFGAGLCDHRIFGICSDGDLMEGISSEAASIAGHLALGRIVMLYDDNTISIDGSTELTFTEDATERMAAMGWHVQRVDGHDPEALAEAIEAAIAAEDRPSLIACRTVIGQGSPSYEGTPRAHGAPLGPDEVRATKERLGMDPDVAFAVPDDVASAFRSCASTELREAWQARAAESPDGPRLRTWLQPDWAALAEQIAWPSFEAGTSLATRKASAACLKAITAAAPMLVGGSADLAGSNGTNIGAVAFTPQRFAGANTLHFGVREHAMGAICNGIALHGGLRPYNATFLAFHDYQRPAVRLSALMHQPVLYIYTHDSIFLGEDGPTHQPIATLLALRALPGVEVWRPADAIETVAGWRESLLRTDGPSALILTRQGLPVLDRPAAIAAGVVRGGYVLADAESPQVVLLATGSEVSACLEARALLAERGVRARVVSLPCRERFARQDAAYRDQVLPAGVPRVSVEAAVTLGWRGWIGDSGVAIGVDTFGASAPAETLAEKFGFTPAQIAARAEALVKA
ncbi:MAG TPA: transketolase [Deltaproteobacteria bacterium]|nr:transketolase [Deltaproteobacteria bacterium]